MKLFAFKATPQSDAHIRYLLPDRRDELNTPGIDYAVPGARFYPPWGATSVTAGDRLVSNKLREHAARLLWDELERWGIPCEYEEAPWPYSLRELTAPEVDVELLKLPFIRESAFVGEDAAYKTRRPWQLAALSAALDVGRYHAAHVPGSGKTLTGILFLLFALQKVCYGYKSNFWKSGSTGVLPTLIFTSTLNPTAQIRRDFQEITTLDPFVYRSKVHRRKKHRTIRDYLASCQAAKQPAVLILGRENLPSICFASESGEEGDIEFFSALREYHCRTIAAVIDEIHKLKSHSRWDRDEQTGDYSLKDNQAAAIYWLLNRGADFIRRHRTEKGPEVPYRLGLSATPVDNRRIDYWAELDLVDPGAFGNYYAFGTAYAEGGPGAFCKFEAKGASNTLELNDRLAYIRHIATSEEVSPWLPPFHRQVKRVSVASQMKVKGSLRTAAKALRGQAIEGDDRDLAAVQYLMSRAAAAVRPVVVDDALEFLRDGKKVLIFTGFVEDVGEIRRQIVSRLRRGTVDEDHKRPIVIGDIWVGSTHGEQHGPDDREALIHAYNQRGEASLLVGTGDSIGESFNIENTDYVLFAQLPITPGQRIQREGRVKDRQRRTRAATAIYYIGENTYATRMVDILFPKEQDLQALGLVGKTDDFAEMLRGPLAERAESMRKYIATFLAGGDLTELEDDDE